MNENVIFAINYILYTIGGLMVFGYEIKTLTPKASAGTILSLWMIVIICGTIKFFMPVYGGWDFLLAIINNMIALLTFKIFYPDKYFKCLFVHAMYVSANILNSMIWMYLPDGDAANNEIGTTIGYLCTIPILYVQMEIISGLFRRMQKKKIGLEWNIALLTMAFAAYTLALSALLQMSSVFAYKSSGYTVVIALITAGMLIFITAAVVLAYMKNAELELKSHLTRLETARSLEEESYRRTLERIEAMAKLRHDFYGQLQAARYLLEADPEEGRKMLEDMMIALPKQK